MSLVRKVLLLLLRHNFTFKSANIPGLENELCDALSHELSTKSNLLIRASYADTTLLPYRMECQKLENFLKQMSLPHSLPVPSKHLCLFIAYLSNGANAHSIRSYLAAIAWLHKLNDLTDPTKSFSTTRMLKGLEKIRQFLTHKFKLVRYRYRLPFLTVLLGITSSDHEAVLSETVFLLAYYDCLRPAKY